MTSTTHPAALITGASSGIGKGFAQRYAAAGHDVVLVARREERLRELAAELTARHGITATVMAADLTSPSVAGDLADRIADAGISVGILVNCAGFGTAGPFAEEDADRVAAEIAVDVTAPTLLTRVFMPSLLAAGSAGALVMVSSTASHQPVAGIAVYAACKGYITSLTSAIWQEARGSGLRVLAVCPGPTDTEFFDASGSEQFKVGKVGSVDEVLDATFAALARDGGPVTTVGLANRIQSFGAKIAPRRMTLAVGASQTRKAARGAGK